MQIGIVCKVIDNYGDAGFSLRLARALAEQNHKVTLFHDEPSVFESLYPNRTTNGETNGVTLIDARHPTDTVTHPVAFDLIIEPFGTSSEQTIYRFDLALKQLCPHTPWLLIDYLSSETWVERFHLSTSIDPATGHSVSYFYPGFTNQTGGLIHSDYPMRLKKDWTKIQTNDLKVFIFAYPNAPLGQMLDACNTLNSGTKKISVWVACNQQQSYSHDWVNNIPFVPQYEFDDLLAGHDILFVRGEDSFVRAQLSGKPLIWQIYPTDDYAHEDKLSSFFNRYASGLCTDCKMALWNCWASWNGLKNTLTFSSSWTELLPHLPELSVHAVKWRDQLFNGPELVKEVLTWRTKQSPESIKKTDI